MRRTTSTPFFQSLAKVRIHDYMTMFEIKRHVVTLDHSIRLFRRSLVRQQTRSAR